VAHILPTIGASDHHMAPSFPPYSTVLVGGNSLFLEGISRLLKDTDFQVIAGASSVDHVVQEDLPQCNSILLILDATHDQLASAIRKVEALRRLHAEPRIAVLTNPMRMADIALLLNTGANACFGAETRPAIFLRSLELVMLGERIALPAFQPRPGEPDAQRPEPPSAPGRLSPQERLILRSLAEGEPNKMIARKVRSAESTVKVHVKNIFRKIGVANRTQAAIWARNKSDL
jgi:two-component system nitrate/nitrite response regulator NarL